MLITIFVLDRAMITVVVVFGRDPPVFVSAVLNLLKSLACKPYLEISLSTGISRLMGFSTVPSSRKSTVALIQTVRK